MENGLSPSAKVLSACLVVLVLGAAQVSATVTWHLRLPSCTQVQHTPTHAQSWRGKRFGYTDDSCCGGAAWPSLSRFIIRKLSTSFISCRIKHIRTSIMMPSLQKSWELWWVVNFLLSCQVHNGVRRRASYLNPALQEGRLPGSPIGLLSGATQITERGHHLR